MSQQPSVCSGCGEPPRMKEDQKLSSGTSETAEFHPLLRCARCHNAWYHDVKCQKAHYPTHKKSCRSIKSGKMTTHSTSKQMYTIRSVPGKGLGMFANTNIPQGTVFHTTNQKNKKTKATYFESLVPSVLHTEVRSATCAWCLHNLDRKRSICMSSKICISSNEKYPMYMCSKECQSSADFEDEVEGFVNIPSYVPEIHPTAVMTYRILRAVARGTFDFSAIQSLAGPKPQFDPNDGASVHAQSVYVTLNHMITPIKDKIGAPWNVETVYAITRRIAMNGFSFSEEDGSPLGFGLFETVCRINHSCVSNVAQGPVYGPSGLQPKLILRAERDIKMGEELFINYTDTSEPYSVRQSTLFEQYDFICKCEMCSLGI